MMKPKLEIDLPDELVIFKEKIEGTIKPYIEIKAQANDHLRLWQSKFGGVPYFPKGLQYPTDSKGQAMFLLAQINFGETPKLESFPEKGILQFYISGESDVYGVCFESPARQDDFRLLFQMDTDDNAGILWGDCGVANFFISEQDLVNRDFSRVLYNWDCC